MADVSSDDVRSLAALSRITLDDEQVERFRDELARILEYVEQLNSVDTSGVEPTSQVTGLTNIMRADTEHDYRVSREELLASVPATEKGYIKVKRVL